MSSNGFSSGTVLVTGNGERRTFMLADGSSVKLNADSFLLLDPHFAKSNREVRLIGEAFFDVVDFPGHPFMVQTTSMIIKGSSTTFDVRAFPEKERDIVLLISGQICLDIRLSDQQLKSIDLLPRQMLTVLRTPFDSLAHTAEVLAIFFDSIMGASGEKCWKEIEWMEDEWVYQRLFPHDIVGWLKKRFRA